MNALDEMVKEYFAGYCNDDTLLGLIKEYYELELNDSVRANGCEYMRENPTIIRSSYISWPEIYYFTIDKTEYNKLKTFAKDGNREDLIFKDFDQLTFALGSIYEV